MPNPAVSPIRTLSSPLPGGEGLGVGERAGRARRRCVSALAVRSGVSWGLRGRRCAAESWDARLRLAPPPLTPPRRGGGSRLEPIFAVAGDGEVFGNSQQHAV